jgi:hypothetical protein
MKIARLAAVFLLASATLAHADEKKADSKKSETKKHDKPTFHASKTQTVTSKVKAVDQKTRMVTLVSDTGEELTFKADQRIKNLPQVKPGDVVTATVTETLNARVLKPGESVPVASEGSTVATAPQGAKPAGYAAKEAYVVASIVAIDKENMIITLKTAKGETFPVKAREKKNVDKLAVGDNIEIHATQSLAVEVTTPQK